MRLTLILGFFLVEGVWAYATYQLVWYFINDYIVSEKARIKSEKLKKVHAHSSYFTWLKVKHKAKKM